MAAPQLKTYFKAFKTNQVGDIPLTGILNVGAFSKVNLEIVQFPHTPVNMTVLWTPPSGMTKVPASQPGNSQADYYSQRGPTEVPPSHHPGIGDSTKAVDNDGCADDPMSRHLRAHTWRSDQQDGDTGPSNCTAVPDTPD
jgi:hypothetical protein